MLAAEKSNTKLVDPAHLGSLPTFLKLTQMAFNTSQEHVFKWHYPQYQVTDINRCSGLKATEQTHHMARFLLENHSINEMTFGNNPNYILGWRIPSPQQPHEVFAALLPYALWIDNRYPSYSFRFRTLAEKQRPYTLPPRNPQNNQLPKLNALPSFEAILAAIPKNIASEQNKLATLLWFLILKLRRNSSLSNLRPEIFFTRLFEVINDPSKKDRSDNPKSLLSTPDQNFFLHQWIGKLRNYGDALKNYAAQMFYHNPWLRIFLAAKNPDLLAQIRRNQPPIPVDYWVNSQSRTQLNKTEIVLIVGSVLLGCIALTFLGLQLKAWLTTGQFLPTSYIWLGVFSLGLFVALFYLGILLHQHHHKETALKFMSPWQANKLAHEMRHRAINNLVKKLPKSSKNLGWSPAETQRATQECHTILGELEPGHTPPSR